VNSLAPDHLPVCPRCDEFSPASSTVCGECGARLLPSLTELPARTGRFPGHYEDCPCTRCLMEIYDTGAAL
jgi:hypothetical protein